jgi:hypothetical protein
MCQHSPFEMRLTLLALLQAFKNTSEGFGLSGHAPAFRWQDRNLSNPLAVAEDMHKIREDIVSGGDGGDS